MRVAVTGASGHVGINLVRALETAGHQVVAIDIKPDIHSAIVNPTWIQANILDGAAIRKALLEVEIVFHLASVITFAREDPIAWQVNIEGARSVAEAALDTGVRRFVHCSSLGAFDTRKNEEVLNELSPRSTDEGIALYGRSKWLGELEVQKVIDRGLDAVICNPTGIYGPSNHMTCRFNTMILRAARGLLPFSFAGEFNMVDVRDIADGLMSAAEMGERGENYLLGGHKIQLTSFLRDAASLTGKPGPMVTIPLGLLDAAMFVLEPIGNILGSKVLNRGLVDTLRTAPSVDYKKAVDSFNYQARQPHETVYDLLVSEGLVNKLPLET